MDKKNLFFGAFSLGLILIMIGVFVWVQRKEERVLKTRTALVQSELRQIHGRSLEFFENHGRYPESLAEMNYVAFDANNEIEFSPTTEGFVAKVRRGQVIYQVNHKLELAKSE